MKRLIAALALTALAASPALAVDHSSARTKRDPNEVVCKVQGTAAGIPTRVCATRAEWEKASSRTRQELMLTQRPMCGTAAGVC
jgi:hypothetical protein